MSQENVEILGAFYEAWNRGDIDDGLSYADPDVEVYPGVQAPDAETRYLGRQGLRDFFVSATGPWETVTAEPKKIIETEDDRILSIDNWRFLGRDGIQIDRELPNLFTFRDGLIARVQGFTNRKEALEAAGLSEYAMSQDKIDVVQRIYEAWGTGDFEAGVGHLDRDVVLVVPPDFPEFGVFLGLDGVRQFMRRFLEQWEHLTIEAKQLQTVGDTVLTRIIQRGRGRTSGIDVEFSYFQLFTFRGDTIVRMDCVMDEAKAREAAGLRE